MKLPVRARIKRYIDILSGVFYLYAIRVVPRIFSPLFLGAFFIFITNFNEPRRKYYEIHDRS